MSHARYAHTATLLPDGKVLITGGISSATSDAIGAAPSFSLESSAELYDPATGTFSAAGDLGGVRAAHTATLLTNGKVLITGGITGKSTSSPTAEIYDPVAGTFVPTGSMSTARSLHTATLLNTGKVLIVGDAVTAELYDAATGSFVNTGASSFNGTGHTATLLMSGEVLIAGGGLVFSPSAVAETYEP